MPAAATRAGSSPSTSASGALSRSRFTNTNGPHVSTATLTRQSSAASNPGSRSERGAARRPPSRPYVQAWYGHWSVSRFPRPCATSVARWRQMLTKPFRRSSWSRTTTIGTRPAWQVANSPGSETHEVGTAYCHVCAKIRVLLGAEDLGVGEPRERQRDAGVEPRCQIVLHAVHTLVVAWSSRIRWASVPMIEIAILGSDSSSFRNPRRGIAITSISVSATTEAERTPPSSSAISPK